MSAVHTPPDTGDAGAPDSARLMPYALRPMSERDVGQAAEIERDAFPTLFPPTSFRRELKNRRARYLVAFQRDDLAASPAEPPVPPASSPAPARSSVARLLSGARSLWRAQRGGWRPGMQRIAGFIGIWYMPDAAHIVAIGVRSACRKRGIGELLLIGAIEQAAQRQMDALTLEVRASNYIAQNLYAKHGFKTMGVRKGYYTDNREDALIMTAERIRAPEYAAHFRALTHAHRQRWGFSDRLLS